MARSHTRLVLAESCTAGRVAATFGSIPGISHWFCGSFVVYRCDSKTKWLGIPSEVLDSPALGPVSAETSRRLATASVERTPEATWGAAITGDIGPNAPERTDGVCFAAFFDRWSNETREAEFRLQSPRPQSELDIAARVARLDEATEQMLRFILECGTRFVSMP